MAGSYKPAKKDSNMQPGGHGFAFQNRNVNKDTSGIAGWFSLENAAKKLGFGGGKGNFKKAPK